MSETQVSRLKLWHVVRESVSNAVRLYFSPLNIILHILYRSYQMIKEFIPFIFLKPAIDLKTDLDMPKDLDIPKVEVSAGDLQRAVEVYNHVGAVWGPIDEKDLTLVGKSLLHYGNDFYWSWIVEGGIRGYSLYIHELTELKWFFKQALNPFEPEDQIQGFAEAHSSALIAEHRFLQTVVIRDGHDFSLCELIIENPHAGGPGEGEKDWAYVQKYQGGSLTLFDRRLHINSLPQVRDWYHAYGFFVDCQISLSPSLGSSLTEFVNTWNNTPDSRAVAEAHIAESPSTNIDPILVTGAVAVLDILHAA